MKKPKPRKSRQKKASKKVVKKKSKRKPRAVGTDGRSKNGKFVKGNQCSVGNKSHTNEKAKALKKALFDAITEADIKKIGKKLISKAKAGDIHATKELFDRIWGRALQEVDLGEETRKTMFDILAVCGLSDGNGD